MIDVILTTLTVIATVAGALVAVWLVVSVLCARLRYVRLGYAAKVQFASARTT